METPAPGHFDNLTEEEFAYAFNIVVLCYLRISPSRPLVESIKPRAHVSRALRRNN
jgi:hypothetical protein